MPGLPVSVWISAKKACVQDHTALAPRPSVVSRSSMNWSVFEFLNPPAEFTVLTKCLACVTAELDQGESNQDKQSETDSNLPCRAGEMIGTAVHSSIAHAGPVSCKCWIHLNEIDLLLQKQGA